MRADVFCVSRASDVTITMAPISQLVQLLMVVFAIKYLLPYRYDFFIFCEIPLMLCTQNTTLAELKMTTWHLSVYAQQPLLSTLIKIVNEIN